jgi:hypothetical protein
MSTTATAITPLTHRRSIVFTPEDGAIVLIGTVASTDRRETERPPDEGKSPIEATHAGSIGVRWQPAPS